MRLVATLLGLAVMFAALLPAAERPDPPKVEIIAHRGASYDAPENTLAAFKLAWEQKADAIECDVFLTKDQQVAVIHDADTKRLAGVSKKVAETDLADLRKLDVGKWKDAKFAGERIPTLAEVLATVPTGRRIFIEVKTGTEIVPFLLRVLTESKLKPEQLVIISFNAEVVEAMKLHRSDLKMYWVVSLNPKKGEKPTAEQLIATGQKIRADGLDLSATPELDAEFARKVKAAKLGLYVWTVNDVAVAKRMIEYGVDGITTDRPAWLREQLK
jgi:glycerophosphoryl diester phosphodiesterase